jgi:hypothetical protein
MKDLMETTPEIKASVDYINTGLEIRISRGVAKS